MRRRSGYLGAVSPSLLAEYEATLLAMHECRVETGRRPTKWNRLADRLQALHLQLRDSPEGRVGISALISHPNETVRSHAAAHALFWDEPVARAELERLAGGHGLVAVTAKYTLLEYDAGRLIPTWRHSGKRRPHSRR